MKETLEELAEKYSINEFPLKKFKGTQWNNQRENCKQDFLAGAKAGAKWQQERSYSEEDVYNLLCSMPNFYNMTIPQQVKARDKWFEQFKKK